MPGSIYRVLSTTGVLGYRFVMTDGDGSECGYITFIRSQDRLTIEELNVASKHRRRGIGEALVRLVLDASHKVELQVEQSNANARRLYERLGFRQTGTRHSPDGETMLILLHEQSASEAA